VGCEGDEDMDASGTLQRGEKKKKHSHVKLMIVSVFAGVIAVLYFNPKVDVPGFDQSHVLEKLKLSVTPEYITNMVHELVAGGDVDLAKQYLSVAQMLHVEVSQSVHDEIGAEDTFLKSSARDVAGFTKGFIYGSGDSAAEVTGGITSDFTVVGDVRDLSAETMHYINNEPVDSITAGLSVIGIALTATTVLSLGTASPESVPGKLAISLIKVAKKTGRISAKLLSSLGKLLKKAVNLDNIFKKVSAIKGMDNLKPKKWAEVIGTASKKDIKIAKVDDLLKSVITIHKSTDSISSTMKLLRYADSPKELKILGKLSRSFGKKTYAIMKILGKGALKISKRAIKKMASIFAAIVSFCYALMTFISSALMKKFLAGLFQ